MNRLSNVFRAGTRASNLALVQTAEALDSLRRRVPALVFETVRFSSPGDRDRITDLRASAADFFTRDLDEAVRSGEIDFAVHSAKDLPEPVAAGLDWFWLPDAADSRDAIVLRRGLAVADLPAEPVIGVSSERRDAYARSRFPGARPRPIRGTIEARLQQLDEGRFDALIMAGAALVRLQIADRVGEWIPLDRLTPPDGQGHLALTYREGDARMNRLRSLFVKAVRFVGAGVGDAALLTLAGRRALERADVCLHDALMDRDVLRCLAQNARRMDVGKRCGGHGMPQEATTRAIADEARKGRRVVRLKGGDAGLFGRLAEELEALDRLDLPYRVLPGVSSLAAATTGTGLLLTRRGVSRGFCALTPRGAGGSIEAFDAAARAALPVVFFMSLGVADEVARVLLAEGQSPATPAAVVLDAGGPAERVIRTTLDGLAEAAAGVSGDAAGLLIVGEICRYGAPGAAGALRGKRVLLTCSEALLDRASEAVNDAGGVALRMPLLRLVPCPEAVEVVRRIAAFDWIVLTSPSAVECFLQAVDAAGTDLRGVPKIAACGPGTAAGLRRARLVADLTPESDFGAAGLLRVMRGAIQPGQRVLRLRSVGAGEGLASELRAMGAEVTDCVLYRDERIEHDTCPACDVVFFASASAVESFVAQGFVQTLDGATVLAIGGPTSEALARAGLKADVIGAPATAAGAIESLARAMVAKEFVS
jgi:uroporphyrinogen III methyltransferase/synthase